MGRPAKSGPDVVGVLAAAIGIYPLIQVILRLRRRARHPDMADPARRLIIASKLGALALAMLIVAANVIAVAHWGVVAAIALIVVDLFALTAAAVGVLVLLERSEGLRRARGYVICELDYPAAPRQVKSTMRRIFRLARSIREGHAYRAGMFGDMELDHLVYSAAERAVLSSELSAAVTDLKPDAKAADKTALDEANAQIDEIISYLREVEGSLQTGTKSARGLSDQMGEPERQRVAAQRAQAAAEASAVRRESARKRVADATARASAKAGVDPVDIKDRIDAVAAGYREAVGASEAARGGLRGADENSCDNSRPNPSLNSREVATKTARVSAAAAKAGAQWYKDRRDK